MTYLEKLKAATEKAFKEAEKSKDPKAIGFATEVAEITKEVEEDLKKKTEDLSTLTKDYIDLAKKVKISDKPSNQTNEEEEPKSEEEIYSEWKKGLST